MSARVNEISGGESVFCHQLLIKTCRVSDRKEDDEMMSAYFSKHGGLSPTIEPAWGLFAGHLVRRATALVAPAVSMS